MKVIYKTEKITLPDNLLNSMKKHINFDGKQVDEYTAIKKLNEEEATSLYTCYSDKLFHVTRENKIDFNVILKNLGNTYKNCHTNGEIDTEKRLRFFKDILSGEQGYRTNWEEENGILCTKIMLYSDKQIQFETNFEIDLPN